MATLSCLALLIASLPGCCSVAWPAGKASSLSPPLQSNVFQFLGGGIRPPLRPASPVQSEFVAAHQELQGRLQHHDASIPLAGHPLRGIIMPAGGSLRLGSAMVVLHVLRRGLGCHLPVEIWHTQDEMDDATRNFLEVSLCVALDTGVAVQSHNLKLLCLRRCWACCHRSCRELGMLTRAAESLGACLAKYLFTAVLCIVQVTLHTNL